PVAPFGVASIEDAVRRTTQAGSGWNGGTSRGSTRYRRLGGWAVLPGIIVGAMLGAAVDCLTTRCGSSTPHISACVCPGMLVGGAIAAYAPRRVAAGFLGAGAGMYAGGAIGGAIQGDCSADHPCVTGVGAGAVAGAIAGGFAAYKVVGP